MSRTYGLTSLSRTSTNHAVVVIHGIRQTGDHIANYLGKHLAKEASSAEVFAYGYNHTLSLVTNGIELAETLQQKIKAARIDLVGYSMGGLVARLAASDRLNAAIDTVLTLATPNRGALSNAQLTIAGQMILSSFGTISPIAPRAPGIIDLTRASEIMAARRQRLLQEDQERVAGIRYVSVPALFYHPGRSAFQSGPSMGIRALNALFFLQSIKWTLIQMPRPHDGIVAEESNNLTATPLYHWPEYLLSKRAGAICHAVPDICADHDHTSIFKDEEIARFIWAILKCDDWRNLASSEPALAKRLRAIVSSP